MKSLIGEMIFGLGIAIVVGAIVFLWQYLPEITKDMKFFYLGLLIIAGMILIIIGAKRIIKYDKYQRK